jgi:hypothetical protein
MVETVAEPGCRRQDERRGVHQAGRGSPVPPGGRGNGVREGLAIPHYQQSPPPTVGSEHLLANRRPFLQSLFAMLR